MEKRPFLIGDTSSNGFSSIVMHNFRGCTLTSSSLCWSFPGASVFLGLRQNSPVIDLGVNFFTELLMRSSQQVLDGQWDWRFVELVNRVSFSFPCFFHIHCFAVTVSKALQSRHWWQTPDILTTWVGHDSCDPEGRTCWGLISWCCCGVKSNQIFFQRRGCRRLSVECFTASA